MKNEDIKLVLTSIKSTNSEQYIRLESIVNFVRVHCSDRSFINNFEKRVKLLRREANRKCYMCGKKKIDGKCKNKMCFTNIENRTY